MGDLRIAKIAASRLVELLEVLNARVRGAEVRSSGRPSGFTDDELLASNSSLSIVNGSLEDTLSVINLSTLPVRECIHNDNLFQLVENEPDNAGITNITSVDNLSIGSIDPRSPGVGGSNSNVGAISNLDHSLDIPDLFGQNASRDLLSIERLRSNIDTGQPPCAMILDGLLKSSLFRSKLCLVDSPHAGPDLESSLCSCRDGIGESPAISCAEEFDSCELWIPGLDLVEVINPVLCRLAVTIWLYNISKQCRHI